jgi:XTP/dITP diphosphohydrolase
MPRLLLASRNAHKTREFRELLGDDFELVDLSAFPEIPDIEETGKAFDENATIKALAISARFPDVVIADDSGLEVDALDGAPGVYSARYSGEGASHQQNIEKLLSELSRRGLPGKPWSARFRCVIALAKNGEVLRTVEGVIEGTIVQPARGTGGFGYDPIFQPNGFEETFGELAAEIKNRISHRARAIEKLAEDLGSAL